MDGWEGDPNHRSGGKVHPVGASRTEMPYFREVWQYRLVESAVTWLSRLAAIATLIPAFFVFWYLSGSDDTPRNYVAPLLGLGVMITAVWSVITTFRALPAEPTRALWISALPVAICLLAWPFAGSVATGRPPLGEYLTGVAWLTGPALAILLHPAI